MKSTMLNTCPVSPYEGVAKTIEEDLGQRPEQLFAYFDKTPVASASLAQVHKAVTKDGRTLAVKVQHRGLREACKADVATVAAIASAAKLLFDGFDLSWLVDEIEANLPKELDFLSEAENAERCQRNLDSDRSSVNKQKKSFFSLLFSPSSSSPKPSSYPRVRVPKPAPDLSSPRMLCMEWIEGIPVADRERILENGLDPAEVASLVAKTFAEMTFKFGFVHSDAHPGNALVQAVSEEDGGRVVELVESEEGEGMGAEGEKKKKKKKRKRRKRLLRASVVLLDHGLYRDLSDPFRVQYAALWAAILAGDEASILRHARDMRAGEAGPLFASMLTMKPWRAISGNDNVFLGEGGAVKKSEVEKAVVLSDSESPSCPFSGAKERPPTTTEALETSSNSSSPPSSSASTTTDSSFADRLAATDADAAEARAYASEHAGDINALLARLPRELLLLLKTNDCLRSLDRSLGVSPANSFVATAAAVKEALFEAGRGDEWGVGGKGGGGVRRRVVLAAAGLYSRWWQS